MGSLIKEMFIGLVAGLVNESNHTKRVSLSNLKCMIQPTLINLHANECRDEFHCYPFLIK